MANDNNPTWLILSHAFNMDGRAASQTITDKIPHLIHLGIEPVVVSAITGKKDERIEHHQVFPALPAALRFDLRHYLKQRISNRLIYRIAMLSISLMLMPFYFFEKLFIRIETHWSWAVSAYFVAARLIKTKKPILIYSTGGAQAAHLAAYWLTKRWGLPWIAELHDPMVCPGLITTKMRRRFSLWLESVICKNADAAWWFANEALTNARARHPELAGRGYCIIPGANPPDFSCPSYQRGKHLVIGYFGSLPSTPILDAFLLGLNRVLQENPTWKKDMQVHLYGGAPNAISSQAIRNFPFKSLVKHLGFLGRMQAIKQMCLVDCLLLLGEMPFCEQHIPSKMYEYFFTNRPILALVWHNLQMTQMLQERGHWVVDPTDIDSIALAIKDLYFHWKKDSLRSSEDNLAYTAEDAVCQVITIAQKCLKVD